MFHLELTREVRETEAKIELNHTATIQRASAPFGHVRIVSSLTAVSSALGSSASRPYSSASRELMSASDSWENAGSNSGILIAPEMLS